MANAHADGLEKIDIVKAIKEFFSSKTPSTPVDLELNGFANDFLDKFGPLYCYNAFKRPRKRVGFLNFAFDEIGLARLGVPTACAFEEVCDPIGLCADRAKRQ